MTHQSRQTKIRVWAQLPRTRPAIGGHQYKKIDCSEVEKHEEGEDSNRFENGPYDPETHSERPTEHIPSS
jgi:hypothetical protein